MNVIPNAMRNLFKGVINDYFPIPYFPPDSYRVPIPQKIH